MKIDNIFKREKIEFFTLDEMENFRDKKGILILESKFFTIFSVTIPAIEDSRERELEIDDAIEEYIEDYSPFDYISKEIILKKDKDEEKILIIMIERGKVETVIAELKDNRTTILGIFPLFLLEFFNLENEKKTYVEIEEERFRLYTYRDKKLLDFTEVEFSRDELLEEPEYLEDYLEESYVFTYDNTDKEIYSSFYFINFRNWRDYQLSYRNDLDFLPSGYQEDLKLKRRGKSLGVILGISIIIETIIFLLLNVYINNKRDYLNTVQQKMSSISNLIKKEKEKITDIEKNISLIDSDNREARFSPIRVSSILRDILSVPAQVSIESIEYKGKNIIEITGKSKDENEFYNFERGLLDLHYFRKINHDFFNYNNSCYDFQLEVEVNYEA